MDEHVCVDAAMRIDASIRRLLQPQFIDQVRTALGW
jgi:hypothetical protein